MNRLYYEIKYYIYSWGFSKYGQTGLENCQYTDSPNKLIIPISKDIKSVFCGEYNSSFILKNNKTYLYGLNTFGQLGNGTHKNTSKKISLIPLKLKIKFQKLSIGGGHILGISVDKNLYSWGLNIFGQLGLEHYNNINEPTIIKKIAIFENSKIKKFEIPDKINVIDIKAGPQHSLILLNDNNIYSCGFVRYGALGYYFNENVYRPNDNNIFTKINLENFINDNEKITTIAAGFAHSGCVLNKKYILIWGKNKNFEFTNIQKYDIKELLNNNNSFNDNEVLIKDFQIGRNFAVILTNSGLILTEGDNSMGQLGHKKNNFFDIVKLNETIRSISVGYDFVYSIGYSGKVYAWGSNKYGQISSFNKKICFDPFSVENISDLNPVLISCGGYHISAICTHEKKIDKSINYLQNYSLNKCFNKDVYKKKEILYVKIKDSIEKKENLIKEIDIKNKEYQEMSKIFEEKQKLYEKNSNKKNKNLDSEIINILDKEINFDELDFQENSSTDSNDLNYEIKNAYYRKILVTVKILKNDSDENIKYLKEELNLLKQLRHPNILLYIGGNITSQKKFLITEFCENGNLFGLLHGKNVPNLEDNEKLNLALEIAQGMSYLHTFDPPIFHKNLKSFNVLLDKNCAVKIANFSFSNILNNELNKNDKDDRNNNEKNDIYSYGVILWEFWAKNPPYDENKLKEMNITDIKSLKLKISEDMPKEVEGLIKLCWDDDYEKRPSFLEIVDFLDELLNEM